MAVFELQDAPDLVAPCLVVALDSWVDSGGASTTAAERLAESGASSAEVIATFDGDVLFDFRSRRPTLEIVDGKLAQLTWPELTLSHARVDEHDVLILRGAEPDFRWHAFADALVELVRVLGVVQWVSLGAIPAAVPHTRPVPIIGTESEPGLLRGDVRPGPDGLLRVPAAAISVLEMVVAGAGTPTVGYFAQVPHYVSGAYAPAALALLRSVERHLGVSASVGSLVTESRQLRERLDAAVAVDETTRSYVERLESMVDEERLPAGEELISEIERFLRDRGNEGTQRSDR